MLRKITAGLLSGVVLSLLAAPVNAQTFRWATPGSAATLDPHASGDTTSRNIVINDYEGLVRLDKESKLEPELALSWEAVEPTVWRFKLRPNVKFHDGGAFTADDVVFSFNRATMASSDIRAKLRAIKEMRKVDVHPRRAEQLEQRAHRRQHAVGRQHLEVLLVRVLELAGVGRRGAGTHAEVIQDHVIGLPGGARLR